MTFVRIARPLFVLLALLTYGSSAGAAEISWYKDLKQASEAAQKNNLPLFIDFWADWCAPCKIMDAEVYTDPKVIETFHGKIIGVRLHFDLQPDMVRRYNVPAIPFLVFTNSYGTPLVYHRGFLEAEDLTKVVEAMPPLAEINELDRRLQKDRNDFESLFAMAQLLRESGFFESSTIYYDRASKHRAARADAARRETILFEMASNSLELQDGKRAAEALERCLKDFPKSTRRPDFLLGLGRAYALDEKPDRARRSLNSVIAEYPQSPAASQAAALLKSL
jgi:thioredoxin-like negative regulator of GroEL